MVFSCMALTQRASSAGPKEYRQIVFHSPGWTSRTCTPGKAFRVCVPSGPQTSTDICVPHCKCRQAQTFACSIGPQTSMGICMRHWNTSIFACPVAVKVEGQLHVQWPSEKQQRRRRHAERCVPLQTVVQSFHRPGWCWWIGGSVRADEAMHVAR